MKISKTIWRSFWRLIWKIKLKFEIDLKLSIDVWIFNQIFGGDIRDDFKKAGIGSSAFQRFGKSLLFMEFETRKLDEDCKKLDPVLEKYGFEKPKPGGVQNANRHNKNT